MRRLFNKQPTVTPFRTPDTYQEQRNGAYDDDDDDAHEHFDTTDPPGPVSYERRPVSSRLNPDAHHAPVGSTISGGYPSYGEGRSTTKGNVSRTGSLTTVSRSSPVEWSPKPGHSHSHSHPHQHHQLGAGREDVNQPTLARTGPYTRSSQYDSYQEASHQIPYNPSSRSRFETHHTANYPKPSFAEPLPNPYDTITAGGLHRRVSSSDRSARPPRPDKKQPRSRQSHDDVRSKFSQMSDSEQGQSKRASKHGQQDSRERHRTYDTTRHSSSEMLNMPRLQADEIYEARTSASKPHIVPERAHERYIDNYDESINSASKLGQDSGKKRVRRMIFGLHRKQREPDNNNEYAKRGPPLSNDVDWIDGEGVQHSVEARVASGRTSAEPKSGRSSPKKMATGFGTGDFVPPGWPDWKALGITKAAGKTEESVVTQQVGWLCAQDEQNWASEYVKPLYDAVSHSESAAKEATRALRKEFKYGAEDAQYRAVKLWAMMFIYSSDRFKLQSASKRFLEVVEDLYSDKRTSTQTRGRILTAWSMLAYQSQMHEDLHPVTKMFNKIKPIEMPANGVPINFDHELFRMCSWDDGQVASNDAATASAPATDAQKMHSDDFAEHDRHLNEQSWLLHSSVPVNPATVQNVTQADVATHTENHALAVNQGARHAEELSRLHQECNVARSNAHVLIETLIEHGLDATLLPEFTEKTRGSLDFLSSHIPWASSQAEQSRQVVSRRQHASTIELTVEEILLSDLLDAHEKVVSAQSMLDEAQVRRREEEEEAQVLDRSMREMRMDRNMLVHDAETGYAHHVNDRQHARRNDAGLHASGSRSASPARGPLPTTPNVSHTHAHSEGLLAPPMQYSLSASSAPSSGGGAPYDSLQYGMQHGLDRSGTSSSSTAATGDRSQVAMHSPSHAPLALSPSLPPLPSARRPGVSISIAANGHGNEPEDDRSEIVTPIQPSEKALGKRRAVSIDETEPAQVNAAGNFSINSDDGSGAALNSVAPSNGVETDRDGILLARPPPALPR